MNASLAQATANECDLKAQIQALQRSLHDASMSSASHSDKYKQVKFLCYTNILTISYQKLINYDHVYIRFLRF